MKKKFLSAMLLGLVALGTSTTFVSCKDYDDDISAVKSDVSSLQTLTTSLQNTLSDLKTQLATAQSDLATAKQNIATNTSSIATNKGNIAENTQNIADLTARVEALEGKIKIAQDALDAVGAKADQNAANITALTTKLQEAVDILNGNITTLQEKDAALQAQIDVINAFIANPDYASLTKAFADLKARIQAAKDKEVDDVSDLLDIIQALSTSLDNEVANRTAAIGEVNVKISNIWAELNILSTDLRSLVYVPYLYVGGIESIEYPYYRDTTMVLTHNNAEWSITRGEQTITIPKDGDYYNPGTVSKDNPLIIINPVTTVGYHLNPSGAATDGDDMANYVVRSAEVVSRADASFAVNSPKTYANGDVAWKNEGGIFTAPFQVATTDWLNTDKGEKSYTGSYKIVAFQAKTKKSTSADPKLVTSDYAMIYPEEMHIEGLVYTQAPNAGNSKSTSVADDQTGSACGKTCHVYATPGEALQAAATTKGADFNLYYNDDEGIQLENYLGIHVTYKQEYTKAIPATRVDIIPFVGQNNKFKRDGLTYEFKTVEYQIGGGSTIDSRFCSLDGENGKIIARNVGEDGKTIATGHNRASIGRQPLVQVLVKYNGSVILDGYILVNITERPVDFTIDKYKETNAIENVCGKTTLMSTTWAQFNQYVLSEGLNNEWTKDQFDAAYIIENMNGVTSTTKSNWANAKRYDYTAKSATGASIKDGQVYKFDAKIYVEGSDGKKKDVTNDDVWGYVTYVYDVAGTTNHTFQWTIEDYQLERIMHDLAGDATSKTFSIYIRYNLATNSNEGIWLKLTTTVTRPQFSATWGEKISNYWFNTSGGDNGTEVIVADCSEPVSGSTVNATWNQVMAKTLKGNELTVTSKKDGAAVTTTGKKFYFAPEVTYITDQDGIKWVVTPQSSSSDKSYNKLYCLHSGTPTDAHTYETSKLESILKHCAIQYNLGAFTNDKLYAVTETDYKKTSWTGTEIAKLDQDYRSGQITIVNTNTTATNLINAVGYAANKGNIMNQLHAKVGVIAKVTDCEVAEYVADPEFWNSWERPINLQDKAQVAVDAQTDMNIIKALDIFNIYDWRGPSVGDMTYGGSQVWFWAFYGIKSITLDLRESSVETDLHQSAGTFVKLSTVTHDLELYPYDKNGTAVAGKKTYTFGSNISSYNKSGQNSALNTYMKNNIMDFGAIIYKNNGENVTEFTVKVPVIIAYNWGEVKTVVAITIQRTHGN